VSSPPPSRTLPLLFHGGEREGELPAAGGSSVKLLSGVALASGGGVAHLVAARGLSAKLLLPPWIGSRRRGVDDVVGPTRQ